MFSAQPPASARSTNPLFGTLMKHKEKILAALSGSGAAHVSGAQLAAGLHVSRTAIWKYIRSLEENGYIIEAVPSKGYRLISAPDTLVPDAVKQGLGTSVIGRDIRLLPLVDSTNTLAMEFADAGAPEGTVVLAEQQQGGKGRLGRTWISPRGNLYVSVVLRPRIPTHKAPLLTLLGAAAVCSAIRKQLDLPAGIKWPNDIFLGGRKTGGLLTEMSAETDRIRHVVLGIGINVNMDVSRLPPGIQGLSTSLSAFSGRKIDRLALLRQLLAELDRRYCRFLEYESAVLDEWRELNVTLGNRVVVKAPDGTFEGLAEDIDSEGRLVVKLEHGSRRVVASGDVTLLKEER